jgi:Sap-like sulfolipid-1-addressing protein
VLAIFTVIASLGVLAPLGLYLGAGERAEATLERWKNWAVANHTTATVVILIVIGLKLLGNGIGILTR